MSNNLLEGLIKDKDYTFKKQLFKIVKEYSLSLNELLLLIYFLNQDIPVLDIETMENIIFISGKEILESFSILTSKNLLAIKIIKSNDGKVSEQIDLSNVYRAIISDINGDFKSKSKENIFSIFEKEFGRTLSPMEYEVINEWVKSGMNEELIIEALKEATYNGVSNLRYIDKILYEWGKKGFKNKSDVESHLTRKTNNKDNKEDNKVLFEYNWLEDEE